VIKNGDLRALFKNAKKGDSEEKNR